MTAPSKPPRPRTLTEALRVMSAEELATLLAARPDLLDPVPEDIAELASRSTTPASITRAIDELNRCVPTTVSMVCIVVYVERSFATGDAPADSRISFAIAAPSVFSRSSRSAGMNSP